LTSHPWIPNLNSRVMEEIGINDVMELFSDIPANIMLKEPLTELGPGMDDYRLLMLMDDKLSRNNVYRPHRMHRPPCPHITPSLVKHVMARSEFYTAYTPYQPEVSQGLLQAFFEYQSMIADLFEMDVVNASHYDGGSALGEAVLMSFRITRKKRVIVDRDVNPFYRRVMETYIRGVGGKVDYVDGLEEDALSEIMNRDVAALIIDNPTFLGKLRGNTRELAETAHDYGALVIGLTEPLSLGVIKPPGEYGADIAVAEGRSLGLGLNMGGIGLGILAARWDSRIVRQMPGRIIGLGEDVEGNRAYTMILQTREQHIRRERATSNITTNEALATIGAAVFMALLGKEGFKFIGEAILKRTQYLAGRLEDIDGIDLPEKGVYYFENLPIIFHNTEYRVAEDYLRTRGILPGLDLSRLMTDRKDTGLFCVSEIHSRSDIDGLVELLGEMAG